MREVAVGGIGGKGGTAGRDPERLGTDRLAPETVHEHLARYLVAAEVSGRLERKRRRKLDVLDLGCGAGLGARQLAGAGSKLVVALDKDPPPGGLASGVAIVRARAENLPFRDGVFDLIVCLEMIEHLADPDRCLAEARRVLEDRGVLLLSTPNRLRSEGTNPHHLNEMDEPALRKALASYFPSVEIEGMAGEIVQRVGPAGGTNHREGRTASIGSLDGISVASLPGSAEQGEQRRKRGSGAADRSPAAVADAWLAVASPSSQGGPLLSSLLPRGGRYVLEGWGPRDSFLAYRDAVGAHEKHVRDLEEKTAVIEAALAGTREALEDLSGRHGDLAARFETIQRSLGARVERAIRRRADRAKAMWGSLARAPLWTLPFAGLTALLVWILLPAAMLAGNARRRREPAARSRCEGTRYRLSGQPGPPPLVSVTIVNWNGGTELQACLEALYRQTHPRIEVLLFDNGSTDGSPEEAIARWPSVVLARSPVNAGFSRAQNELLGRARGEFLLPLNFDVVPDPQFVARLSDALVSDPDLGMVSGKLVATGEDGRARIDSTGVELAGYYCADRDQGREPSEAPAAGEVFGASGAAPLYRRAMVEEALRAGGGEVFDEDFVQYVEDVDLAWRARLLGWRAAFVPRAIARHERGTTRRGGGAEKEEIRRRYLVQGMRNRYLMIVKNAHLRHVIRHWPRLFADETRFWVHCAGAGKRYAFGAVGEMPGLLGRMVRKRASIRRARSCAPREIESWVFPASRGDPSCA